MSLNKVMLIGNVGRDPNVRYLDGNSGGGAGSKVATFTLATTERFKDRSGETRENTEWHNIVAWRNSADLAEKFIHKGTMIYVEGRLRTRSSTDQAGVQKYTTEVVADNIQLLSRRQDDEGADGQQQYGGQGQQYGQPRQGYQQPQAPAQQYGGQPAPAYQAPQYGQPAPPVQPIAPAQPASTVQPATEIPAGLASDPSDDLPF